jgi:hypothetical protein
VTPLSKDDLLERVEGVPEIVGAVLEATDEDQIVRTEVRLLEESATLPDALAAFQSEREGDVSAIEETGRRNERMSATPPTRSSSRSPRR